jgi:glycosyltransferase involved in cell wall biosynthesis
VDASQRSLRGLQVLNVKVAGGRRIAILIRSLGYGGAETQVVNLANGLAKLGHSVSLIGLYPGGPLLRRLRSDVIVYCLERRDRRDVIGFLNRLYSDLNKERPEVLYSFLPIANLLACLSKVRFPSLKVAWGVRASDIDLRCYDWLARVSYWLERRLSRFPDLIISNSAAGRRYAVSQGFPDNDRFIVIPNGIDVEHFQPDQMMREAVRGEWRISVGETLIGVVGRIDPMKDHGTFLQAAAKMVRSKHGMRFVSVGSGPEDYSARLKEQARCLGLEAKMIWAGPRDDLASVYNALDLLVSSSAFGEGFSNVLAEAMACGVPCVATDVGDSRELLGDNDAVVPRRDAEALTAGVMAMLERKRVDAPNLSAQLRRRIRENFSVETLVERTSAALETI